MSPTSTAGGYHLGFQAVSGYLPASLKRKEVIKIFYNRKILSEPMRYKKILEVIYFGAKKIRIWVYEIAFTGR